jgi:membrane associated rhomboid family serine protease
MFRRMSDDSPDSPRPEDLAEVGRYAKFSHAQERGLVAGAMELPYWVEREGRDFVLYVEPAERERVADELAKFEAETAERELQRNLPAAQLPKLETLPLFLAGWVMSMFWGAQNLAPESWVDLGDASNRKIFAGEWWRTITALTLHGDLAHFAANLGFGLLFTGFLIQRLGGGVTWLGFVLSGAFGNLLNAWFYRRELHSTIGASTAVFGALGMLVAWESLERWRFPGRRGWWHLIVPIGGGLSLLAWLGAGGDHEQRIDYMAHLWGFVAGLVLGVIAVRVESGKTTRRIAGVLAFVLPLVAWALALRR